MIRLRSIRTAYDIFIDEITYTAISKSVDHGQGVALYGQPFNLHPPFMFLLWGGARRLFDLTSHDPEQEVLKMRVVTAVLGALLVGVAYLIARRASGRNLIALTVAVLYALDPFAVYYDSRVMLETGSQLFIALTVLMLLYRIHGGGSRYVYAAGVASAVAVNCKETFGLVLVALLLIALATGWTVRRRDVVVVLVTTAVGYGAAVLAVSLTTGFGPWWTAHTFGFRRLIGTQQVTGFNAPTTHVSLLSRALVNLSYYGVTYATLLLGGLVTLKLALSILKRRRWLLRGPDEDGVRLVTLWSFAACSYLGYATAFGSIEEQMYYIPLLPTLLVLTAALSRPWLWKSGRRVPAMRIVARTAVSALLVAALGYDVTVWTVTHSRRADVLASFMRWERLNIPEGSHVAVDDFSSEYLIRNVVSNEWWTLAQLKQNRADYVVLSPNLQEQGYTTMPEATYTYLQMHAPTIFHAATSQSNLTVYDVRGITGGSGAGN